MKRMHKVITASIISTSLLSANIAICNEPAIAPQVAIITRAGVQAPFPGLLYSQEAIDAEKKKDDARTDHERFLNKKIKDQGEKIIKLELATSTTSVALKETIRTYEDRLTMRDERIAKLEDDQSTDWDRVKWVLIGAGSVVLGALSIKLAK